jgi:hypothetical protein
VCPVEIQKPPYLSVDQKISSVYENRPCNVASTSQQPKKDAETKTDVSAKSTGR